MARLALVVITLNEKKNIQRCLESVYGLADEIVVVDSGSTDGTVELATREGAQVIYHPFENHISQKNFAFNQTSAEWILSLDADEALSPTLKKSIKEAIDNARYSGYTMNRLTYYCGRWIRHSGWYPDKKLRLVKKGTAHWAGLNPHDRLVMNNNESIGHLKGDILHYSYYSLQDHLQQMDSFTRISAEELYKKGIEPNFFHFTIKPAFKFLRHYILKFGFLDGFEGYQIARMSACGQFLKYARLRQLHKNNLA